MAIGTDLFLDSGQNMFLQFCNTLNRKIKEDSISSLKKSRTFCIDTITSEVVHCSILWPYLLQLLQQRSHMPEMPHVPMPPLLQWSSPPGCKLDPSTNLKVLSPHKPTPMSWIELWEYVINPSGYEHLPGCSPVDNTISAAPFTV